MILYNQFDRACFASSTAYVLLLSSHVNYYDGEAEKEEDVMMKLQSNITKLPDTTLR